MQELNELRLLLAVQDKSLERTQALIDGYSGNLNAPMGKASLLTQNISLGLMMEFLPIMIVSLYRKCMGIKESCFAPTPPTFSKVD